MFAKSPPDFLISDIALPDEDGAYARPEDRDRALAAGFQRYLAKPVDVLELIAVVAALSRDHAT
jgi:hypothetical protein